MLLQLAVASSIFLSALNAQAGDPTYKNPRAPTEARIKDALERLTLEEKVAFLAGDETGFATRGNTRLGIPSIKMTDGPLGVRSDRPTTAFPSGISMAASFDPELVSAVSRAMAMETRAEGRDMLLGPCIDISRNPFGGRNFESMGEDPYLTSQLTKSYLQGIQAGRVIPSTKHFAMNDQEFKRMTIDVIADERTMHEIHLPAFHEAVQAGTWTIMAAYNKINGYYASENNYLLTKILKEKWGFKGFVVSDWGATHSTVAAANAGLDLEMPSADFFDDKLLKAVQAGQVSEATINDKVSRILRVIFASGHFDADPKNRPDRSVVGSAEHLNLARQMARASIVLLKNDTIRGAKALPMQATKSLAVIGPGALYPRISGGGSSMVSATRRVNPLDVLRERLPSTKVQYAIGTRLRGDFDAIPKEQWSLDREGKSRGVMGEYFTNINLEGTPLVTRVDPNIDFDYGLNAPAPGMRGDNFSVRWTGYLIPQTTGDYNFSIRCDDGARFYVDDEKLLDKWFDQGDTTYRVRQHMQAGRSYKIRMEYYQHDGGAVAGLGFDNAKTNELDEAVALAAKSDTALVFVGTSSNYESEGGDREGIALPENQDELVQRVLKANPHTIVVINAGNPVTMPWLKDVAGLIYAWFPGQEGSEAIADILLGKVNPSGKLPVSFPKRWEDAAAYDHYPEDRGARDQVTYREGIYVGYRHFDTKGIEPLFPFGFGLSYTNFQFSNLKVSTAITKASQPEVDVSLDVTNTGAVAGAEAVQLYVTEQNPTVDRPSKELKGFRKVALAPGETKRVSMRLTANAFSFYDVKTHDWKINPGKFQLKVGASSRDIRLSSTVEVAK